MTALQTGPIFFCPSGHVVGRGVTPNLSRPRRTPEPAWRVKALGRRDRVPRVRTQSPPERRSTQLSMSLCEQISGRAWRQRTSHQSRTLWARWHDKTMFLWLPPATPDAEETNNSGCACLSAPG